MMSDFIKSPTIEQYEAFGKHVCQAHSWYKHLPLFEGAKFYFFLSESAGAGYADEKTRMHYSWQTTREYQERFGALDYVYQYEETGCFHRDAGLEILQLPKNIQQNSVPLTAFVNVEEDVLSTRIKKQTNDIPPTFRNWLNVHLYAEGLWNQLTYEETDLAIQNFPPKNASNRVIEYLAANDNAHQMLLSLMENERRKVFGALEKLRTMELANETVWLE